MELRFNPSKGICMSVFTRMARGCHLGVRSLIVVLRDKTLLVFPMIPFTTVIAIATIFWWLIGSDLLIWSIITTHMMKARSLLIAFSMYLLFGAVSVFFSVALASCTRITLEERDSKFLDGFRQAIRNTHWIVIWTLISWTFGPLLNLLDHQRYTTLWVRKMLKSSWSTISYFVIPILVVDQVNVFSALRRSVEAMSKAWGKGAVSRLGLYWFFFLLNIPTIALFAAGHYPDGPWPNSLTLVVLLYIYTTIVVYQTANSVLSVVLYKYASDGTVVPGFKEEHLKNGFAQPVLYVLALEDPGEGYRPVETVAPEKPATEAPVTETPEAPIETAPETVEAPEVLSDAASDLAEAPAPEVPLDATVDPSAEASPEDTEKKADA
jgi:hypothetical protein